MAHPRPSTRAGIGLGANLGSPSQSVQRALADIAALPHCTLLASSRLYRSLAIGPEGQPDYCNAAVLIETQLQPQALLEHLQAIEQAHGRSREGPRWGARSLDLDLLFYGAHTQQTATLTLPHPELHRRNFVLTPLAEIAADVSIRGLGSVAALAAALSPDGLSLWA